MLAPKGLKIGDVFTEDGVKKKITEVIPFIGYNTITITEPYVKTEEISEDEKPSTNLEDMTIKELQNLCKERGLSIRGSKSEVIERLRSK